MKTQQHVLYYLFRYIDAFVHRGKHAFSHSSEGNGHHLLPANDEGSRYLWVYVSTIGELNAIYPFVIRLLTLLDIDKLVIVTDHPHYSSAYLKKFPQAIILDHGDNGSISKQAYAYTPILFIIAEIPCVLSDAPCRFSYRVVHEMKARGVPVVVVNGWLYGYAPSCRIDRVEKYLLNRNYLSSIDLYCVQTDAVRTQLLEMGVREDRVFSTGNIKFDAVEARDNVSTPTGEFKLFLDEISLESRPVIVAGCVTNVSEQEELLDAFDDLRAVITDALLILAPRHPENTSRMETLDKLLRERQLSYIFRTEYCAGSIHDKTVVVLNTIGELSHTYSIGNVCYVGLNHNVLEPLAMDKPVVVMPGWNDKFPSYPVYQQTLEAGLIEEVSERHTLHDLLLKYLKPSQYNVAKSGALVLGSLAGATQQNLEIMAINGFIPESRPVPNGSQPRC